MKNCKHKNKAYEDWGIGNSAGYSTNWICKDCGYEGVQHSPRVISEYNETKAKFSKEETS